MSAFRRTSMIKSKFFVIATITYATLIQTALTKEISGKVGWLEADTNADGVISFIEFEERDQFDTGPRDKDGDGLLSLDEFLQPNLKKTGLEKLPKDFLEKQESLATKKFEKMDTDFNGFLDAAELQDARFDAMDQNGDGVLAGKELRPKRQFRGPKGKDSRESKARGRGQEKRGTFKHNWRQWQRN